MQSLRSRLSELASSFSASLLEAIRGASLEELVGGQGRAAAAASTRGARRAPVAASPAPAKLGRGGRVARRSAGDIHGLVESIVALLKASPSGLRAEQIREKLRLQAKELPRPLKEGLDAGSFSKSGQKRATTYFVGGGGQKVAARAARGATAKRGAGATARGVKRGVKAKAGSAAPAVKKTAASRRAGVKRAPAARAGSGRAKKRA
jgi:hypothetical protein